MSPEQLSELQRELADRYVIEVILADSVAERSAGQRWFDTRPMLDEREHALPTIDQAREVLAYAEARGLIKRHTQHGYLVRTAKAAR